jgi:iron complex outermembrane receptor protein
MLSSNNKLPLVLYLYSLFFSIGCYADNGCDITENTLDMVTLTNDMSFTEVMGLSITTTANKKKQCVKDSAAAVFVISNKDIQRSGATTIADALRLAPGVQVARYSSHTYAITMRGFNGAFSSNLLMMIDGRSVYNTEFSGVFWDIADTMLADIERIEVIRGPGGTLWGANAVNGVINVITKKAKDTQGRLFVGRAGVEEKGGLDLRYGGVIDAASNTYFRVYAKNLARDAQKTDSGSNDRWSKHQLGFKIEGEPDEDRLWTVQGDTYSENLHEGIAPLNSPTHAEGANLLARITQKFSENSELKVQAYYDYSLRNAAPIKIADTILDLDIQHHHRFNESNEFMWGVGYRTRENTSQYKISGASYQPTTRRDHLLSSFLQDELALVPKTLRLTLGVKLEHNSYTGFEAQPNARLLWSLNSKTSAWASFSRSVRIPSRIEQDLSITLPLESPIPPVPFRVEGKGNKSLKAESTLAYEVGFRQQVTPHFEYDIAGFYNHYSKLRGSNPTLAFIPPDANNPFGAGVVSTQALNNMYGNGYGVEVATTWKPFDWWQLKTAYTFIPKLI